MADQHQVNQSLPPQFAMLEKKIQTTAWTPRKLNK
jgi:hypothetical protein